MTVSWNSEFESYGSALMDMSLGDMVKTEAPNIYCTSIPSHWRSNKSLPTNFRVLVFDDVKVRCGAAMLILGIIKV